LHANIAYRSSYFNEMNQPLIHDATSPIAADGGFGPMDYGEDEEDGDDSAPDNMAEKYKHTTTNDNDEPEEDGFGDDFDDFEEGAAEGDDDFGDFDDGFVEATQPEPQAKQPFPSTVPSLVSSQLYKYSRRLSSAQYLLFLVLFCTYSQRGSLKGIKDERLTNTTSLSLTFHPRRTS
jgi:hypothetical protein